MMLVTAVNWFEIPVKDFKRASAFYGKILDVEIHVMPHPEYEYGVIPCDMEKGIGGAIVAGPGYEPSMTGSLVYLSGGDDLSVPLAKVEAAGGKILLPKTSIGSNGFMAHFVDSEGNKVAFHSIG